MKGNKNQRKHILFLPLALICAILLSISASILVGTMEFRQLKFEAAFLSQYVIDLEKLSSTQDASSNRLVFVRGELEGYNIVDEKFDLQVKALGIKRFQQQYIKEEHRCRDGSNVTTSSRTCYRYRWKTKHIEKIAPEWINFKGYQLPMDKLLYSPGVKFYPLNKIPDKFYKKPDKDRAQVYEGKLYYLIPGQDIYSPRIGDIRYYYSVLHEGMFSMLGILKNDKITPYSLGDHNLFYGGEVSLQKMIEREETADQSRYISSIFVSLFPIYILTVLATKLFEAATNIGVTANLFGRKMVTITLSITLIPVLLGFIAYQPKVPKSLEKMISIEHSAA